MEPKWKAARAPFAVHDESGERGAGAYTNEAQGLARTYIYAAKRSGRPKERPLRRLKGDDAKVLKQRFHADEDEHRAAHDGCGLLEARAEKMADGNAYEAEHEGDYADDGNARHDGHLQKREGDAHGKRVDAGGYG